MEEKIAFITTGGTIGAVLQGDTVGIDATSSHLSEKIAKISQDFGIKKTIFSALDKISEDMNPSDWGVILSAVDKAIGDGFNKLIITHGTDTLTYTSSILHYFYGSSPVKISITGAFYPLSHPRTDVVQNLEAAVRVVVSDTVPNGVYVSFKEAENIIGIYRGFDVKPMLFDETRFNSRYGRAFGCIVRENLKILDNSFELRPSLHLKSKIPSPEAFARISGNVVQFHVYPGMDLSHIRTNNDTFYIVSLYHSGTAPFSQGRGGLIDFIKKNYGRVFLCAYPSEYITNPYESTMELIKAGGLVVKDLTPQQVYSFLVACLALGYSRTDIFELLDEWSLTTELNRTNNAFASSPA